jgi:hypothetical protein
MVILVSWLALFCGAWPLILGVGLHVLGVAPVLMIPAFGAMQAINPCL